MLSRVAESIYWMSRQVERAENLARFLEVTHHLILDQPEDVIDPWGSLIHATGDSELFSESYAVANADTATEFLAFDRTYPNSMLASLQQARENARGMRESISSEVFEQINEFYHFVNKASQLHALDSPSEFFDSVRRIAIQWTGVLDSTLSHDIGWHFANVGRMIERADKTSRILDVKYFNLLPRVEDVGTATDDMQWSALLAAISAFEAYRRKHNLIDIQKVVEFFLFNQDFPRSVLFCTAAADDSLEQIQKRSSTESPSLSRHRIGRLRHRLTETSVKEVLAGGMHEFVDVLQGELNQVGEAMNDDYFQVVSHS
jgi:uncharacterized alpha-E superfamily protein